MTRPSKEQVEAALCTADRLAADKPIAGDDEYILEEELRVLAAEVVALRETEQKFVQMLVYVEQLEHNHGELEAVEIGALRAIISRISALPDNWRTCAATVNDPTSPSIYVDCAEDLERVLNDG